MIQSKLKNIPSYSNQSDLQDEIEDMSLVINGLKSELVNQLLGDEPSSSSSSRANIGLSSDEKLQHRAQQQKPIRFNQIAAQLPALGHRIHQHDIIYPQQYQQKVGLEPPSIMFSRLDVERNTKRLQRALSKGSLNKQDYDVST